MDLSERLANDAGLLDRLIDEAISYVPGILPRDLAWVKTVLRERVKSDPLLRTLLVKATR
jgi:hypothetical protein